MIGLFFYIKEYARKKGRAIQEIMTAELDAGICQLCHWMKGIFQGRELLVIGFCFCSLSHFLEIW